MDLEVISVQVVGILVINRLFRLIMVTLVSRNTR